MTRAATCAKAEHLVEAARELLEEAALTVPDGGVSDDLRECINATVDPIHNRLAEAAAGMS